MIQNEEEGVFTWAEEASHLSAGRMSTTPGEPVTLTAPLSRFLALNLPSS